MAISPHLEQDATLFEETKEVGHHLVDVPQNCSDDCGLSQAGQKLWIDTKQSHQQKE